MKPATTLILLILLALVSTTPLRAKEKPADGVYAFAIGTCLSDSVVYVSAITPLDSAAINSKTKFLQDRKRYSDQFKMYLDLAYSKSHTCAVFFSTKKDALEKKYVKLRHRYNKKEKDVLFIEIPADQFRFVNTNNGN